MRPLYRQSLRALVMMTLAACLLSYPSQLAAQSTENNFPGSTAVQNSANLSSGSRQIEGADRGNSTTSNENGSSFLSGLENTLPSMTPDNQEAVNFFTQGPDHWTSPKGLTSSLQILVLLTVLSLAPSILLMTTCYVRIIVVMGLLRQALGTGQLPPSQVITAIALFMTVFTMAPVWNEVYESSIRPYSEPGSQMTLDEAWEKGSAPIHRFMSRQIDMAGNHDDVHLFYSYYKPGEDAPASFEEVPLRVLVPAYMLSELKIAFAMGFQIYLPFLILDIVVASVTISMGMMMLPPAMISLPFKLMLFVLVDGWRLVVSMLLESFGTYVT